MPSAAAIECTSSKGMFVCPLSVKVPATSLSEYISPLVEATKTTAPASTTCDTWCESSKVMIASPSARSEPDQVLLNGLTAHTLSTAPSSPLNTNCHFANHTPFKPPVEDCAVDSSDQVDTPSNLISSELLVPSAVVANIISPTEAIPVKL